jgi:hypothetical protein
VQSWRKPREEQKEEERGENGPKLNQLLLPNATIEEGKVLAEEKVV